MLLAYLLSFIVLIVVLCNRTMFRAVLWFTFDKVLWLFD